MFKFLRDLKIGTKIFWVFFISSTVIAFIAASVFYLVSARVLSDSIGGHIKTTAKLTARDIRLILKQYKNITSLIARDDVFKNYPFGGGEESEVEVVFDKISKIVESNKSLLYKIKILNKDGIVLTSTAVSDIGRDIRLSDSFLEGKEGTYLSEIHYSKTIKAPGIDIAAPIIVGGDFKGVVVIDFRLDEFYNILLSNTFWGTEETYLINKDGYIISPLLKTKGDVFLKEGSSIGIFNHCLEEHKQDEHQKIRTYTDYVGDIVIGSHLKVTERDWCLVVEIDKKEALDPLKILLFLDILIIVIVTIFSVAISLLFKGYITKPILSLRNSVKVIEKGDLDHKVGINSKDEIGELSRAFDKMVIAIKQSRADIDKKVKDQTRQIVEKQKIIEKNLEEMEENKVGLDVMNEMMVGREVKMIELKEENEKLKRKLNK